MSDFAANISQFVARANGNVDAVVRKIILDIGTKIVMRSPVGDAELWQSPPPPGYVGGRFRANWQYTFGQPATQPTDAIDPSGSSAISGIQSGVSANKAAGLHYLSNNLPYAKRLEEGWSTQAPAGMVGLTLVEFENTVRDAAGGVS
jgi:hypothetical protein